MAVVFKTFEIIEIDGIPAGNIVDVISNHAPRRTEVLAAFGVFVERLKAELAAERDSLQSQVAELTTSRDDLQTQISELQTVNSQLTTQVTDFQVQLDTALAKIAEYEAKEAEPVATMGQVRKWLIMNYGPEITSQVNKLLSEIQDPIERACAISDWEYANIMLRTNPLVTTLANALGMNEEQTNAAYLAASQLP